MYAPAKALFAVDIWQNTPSHLTIDALQCGKFNDFLNFVMSTERRNGSQIIHFPSANEISDQIHIEESQDVAIKAKAHRAQDLHGAIFNQFKENVLDGKLVYQNKSINKIYLVGYTYGVCVHAAYLYLYQIIKDLNLEIELSIVLNLTLIGQKQGTHNSLMNDKPIPVCWRNHGIKCVKGWEEIQYKYALWSVNGISEVEITPR